MNSAVDVWSKVQDILKKDLTETAISTWFDDCSAVELKGNRFILHTPTKYKKEMIEERFLGIIKSALDDLFSSGDFEVIILDDDGLNIMKDAKEDSDVLATDEYTFEHFVVGNSNKLAHAASVAFANGEKMELYNPLFIHGESGLGKTHLLNAIRHDVESKFPHFKVVYIKSEDFTNELITAVREGKNTEFREKYRGADYFLMDDIQFIAGKTATQEEYFNTFNTLFELGKRIAFTSDRPPKEMPLLEGRLKSRFEQGQIVDIQPPDEVLRIAIIKNKAKQLGVILPDDVVNYIADNLDSNVRQLEGAVKMIIAYRDIMEDDITVDSVKTRLKDMFKGERHLIPTTETIIEESAKFYSQTPEDLKGLSRHTETLLARQIAMYLIRKITNLSLKDTGVVFGKDHTTVINAVNKVQKRLSEDKEFSDIIRDITSNIDARTSNR